MNTKKIYSLLNGNPGSPKRSSLRAFALSAVLVLSGTAAFAVGTPPAFVHGTAQTMAVCQDAVPTQINSLLAVTDPNTGETETWTVFSGPAHGSIVTGSSEIVVAGTATPTGFTYTPDGGYSGTDVFTIEVYDGSNSAFTTVTVTINALPEVQTFTGGGGYCTGGTGVHIGLTLSEAGYSYQLYEAPSTAVGSPVIGTGAAIDFGEYANPVYYYAIASNGSCTSSLPGVTIHVDALPAVFSVTGSGNYCVGGSGVSVGLDGSAVGVSYQLYESGSPVGSPVAGTGSAIDFGTWPVGTYTAIATDNTTTCVIDMDGGAIVDTYPLPTVFNVIGGGDYCLGGSGHDVLLDGSEADVNYQLVYLGFLPLGSAVAGTGDTLNMGTEYLPGDYTITATNTVTGCTNNMNGDATVTFNLPPAAYTVTQTRGGNYCVGDSGIHVGLSNSAVGVDYQLYRNDTAVGAAVAGIGSALDFGLFTTVGTYRVRAINTNTGCTRTMAGSSVVVVNPIVAPTVQISSGIGTGNEVCFGSIATFTAETRNGGTAPTYEWKVNNISVPATDSAYTYLPVNGEVLTVVVRSNALCVMPETATNSITVNVDTLLAPSVFISVDPQTSVIPGTPVTVTAVPSHGGPSPMFQWYKNGIIIPGATTSVYTSSSLMNRDSLTCMMTSSGGCGGYVATNSVIITVFGTSVSNVSGAITDVKLAPNPNKGAFSINGTLAATNDVAVSVEVTNMLGQVVYTNKVIAKGGIVNEQIQLGTSASGMYILSIRTATEQSVIRFVVAK